MQPDCQRRLNKTYRAFKVSLVTVVSGDFHAKTYAFLARSGFAVAPEPLMSDVEGACTYCSDCASRLPIRMSCYEQLESDHQELSALVSRHPEADEEEPLDQRGPTRSS